MLPDNPPEQPPDEHKHPSILIFIDEVSYRVDVKSMTGAQLKALAKRPENYQLFLERPGHPDEPIANDQSVELHDQQHFHTVPPANFG